MVSDLIDFDNWTWKLDVVRDNFVPLEADAILNIPIKSGGGRIDLHGRLKNPGTTL